MKKLLYLTLIVGVNLKGMEKVNPSIFLQEEPELVEIDEKLQRFTDLGFDLSQYEYIPEKKWIRYEPKPQCSESEGKPVKRERTEPVIRRSTKRRMESMGITVTMLKRPDFNFYHKK